MFDVIHQNQTVKVLTVRMDGAIYEALKKLRFTQEAPSVNKTTIWAILDHIFASGEVLNSLRNAYGFETIEDLKKYLNMIYNYPCEDEDAITASKPLLLPPLVQEKEEENAQIA